MESIRKSPSIVDWMTGSHLTSQQAKQRQLVIKYVAIAALLVSGALLVAAGASLVSFSVWGSSFAIAVALLALHLHQKPSVPERAIPKLNITEIITNIKNLRDSKTPVYSDDFTLFDTQERVSCLVVGLQNNVFVNFKTNDSLKDKGLLAVKYLGSVLKDPALSVKKELMNTQLFEIASENRKPVFEYRDGIVYIAPTLHSAEWKAALNALGVQNVEIKQAVALAQPATKQRLTETTAEQSSFEEHYKTLARLPAVTVSTPYSCEDVVLGFGQPEKLLKLAASKGYYIKFAWMTLDNAGELAVSYLQLMFKTVGIDLLNAQLKCLLMNETPPVPVFAVTRETTPHKPEYEITVSVEPRFADKAKAWAATLKHLAVTKVYKIMLEDGRYDLIYEGLRHT